MDHRQIDERLAALGQAFIVLSQPMVVLQPGKRALDNPAMRLHREAHLPGGFAHNLQHPPSQGGGPVYQPLVSPIRSEFRKAREALEQAGKQFFASCPVGATRGQHRQSQDQPQGIDDQMPLTTFDVLAWVVTSGPPFLLVGTLWESMTAALGETSRSAASRTCSRSVSWSCCQVPSRRQLR